MIEERAYAKLNLALDVVKKREDGYHELNMIMIPIDLYDTLLFEPSETIELISNLEIKDNAIIKTADLLKETYQVSQGAKITLNKTIPLGAGLAGGSADIAATLRGLNQLWNLQLSLPELEELALKLGSDTLFCLYNKPAYVYGRGEHLLFIDAFPDVPIYLFFPNVSVSTKVVFEHHRIDPRPQKFQRVLALYINHRFKKMIRHSFNQLLSTTLFCYPELMSYYTKIRQISRKVMMSGSGSTFFLVSFKKNQHKIEEKIAKIGLIPVKTRPKT